MAKKIASVRGMNDILPSESVYWQQIESRLSAVLAQYCYQEIRFPLIESTDLFQRSVGEVTDIVEKEMYTFPDRNEDSLSLRPEGTAGCVRAAEQNGLLYNQIQRLWYIGPMFRYERPQKGRARQFHQVGAEAFGIAGVELDLELLSMTQRMFNELGVDERLELQINSIGDSQARKNYSEALTQYLRKYEADLDEDSQKRLQKNPLRILDSKDAGTQKILTDAPVLDQFLSSESKDSFEKIQKVLSELDIDYKVNTKLVRGLDYYNDLVFEWVSQDLGAQGTVCAGGRYDSLVQKLGGRATPAAGFAMGLERLVLLLHTLEKFEAPRTSCGIFTISIDENFGSRATNLVEKVRTAYPNAGVMYNGKGSLKSQIKKADKSGAEVALLIGLDELAEDEIQVKFLRDDKPPIHLKENELIAKLKKCSSLTELG